jgi:protein subunit release factor B
MRLLFSLTSKDFMWDTFRAGGKGGQHQNKVESGVRCTHQPSGAVGIARDSREQYRNKRNAFTRCVESEAFKKWHKVECAKRLGNAVLTEEEINAAVDKQMSAENLLIEIIEK